MATCWIISVVAFLALSVRLAACADCTGPTSPAKLRALYIADVKDRSPADVRALAAAYDTWINGCKSAGLVVREGHAAAITQDPAFFGFKTLPNNSYMGDFGGWHDWRSLEDLRACVARGIKEGSITAMRRIALRAARIVFSLETDVGVIPVAKGLKECSDKSFAPAKVRLMIANVLKDPSTVPPMIDMQRKLTAAVKVQPIRYGTGGRAALGKDEYVWGKGINKTADWGVWYDFASADDVRGFYKPDDAVMKLRMGQRSLHASVVRIVIPLA